jgi:ABC-2 type transport system permease protein
MKSKEKLAVYTKFAVYLLVVVLVNVTGMTLFFRWDLTENRVYSLSQASKDVVETLTEPLTISVFFTDGLDAPYNSIERYLRDLLEEYALSAGHFFNYRFYNVSPDTEGMKPSAAENQRLAESYGIQPVQIQVIEEDEVKFVKAYMGLVIIHGDMVERIPIITSVDGLEYKLTTSIQKLNNKVSALLNLPNKIDVKLVMSSVLKKVAPFMGIETLASYPDELEKIIASVNARMYGKLAYSFIDPSTATEQQTLLDRYTLIQLHWPALSNGIPEGKGVIGMVMEYDGKVRSIPLLSAINIPLFGTQYQLQDLGQLEDIINENVETLVDIHQHIGYISDHGTPSIAGYSPYGGQPPDALNNFTSLLSENYTIKEINLKDDPIPSGLSSLVIAKPMEKFTDYELYQIDQALMRGTNLILFLDVLKQAQNTQPNMGYNMPPTLEPFDSGLEKLLGHYGVEIKKSVVLDENCYVQRVSPERGGGEQPVFYAPIIKNENINHELPFLKEIKGLVAVKVSPLELKEERLSENHITSHVLISSSENSWEMRDRITLSPMLIRPPLSPDEKESMPLAVLLEGEFPSYFEGKPIPEKIIQQKDSETEGEDEEAEEVTPEDEAPNPDLQKIERSGDFLAKGEPAKIFLMGSGEMLQDNVLSKEGKAPNTLFVLNILDMMNDREDIAVMRSKVQNFNPLSDTTAAVKSFIKIFNIAGLPCLVVFFGLLMMLHRHARKKKIRMIFTQ